MTNCVSFSALYDPSGSSRYCTITATNVDDEEDVLTTANSGSVSSGTKYNVELTGLSASKYYKVVVETNNGSDSKIYQIRLGANTDGPFSVTYNANGGTGTMTDNNSPYTKNATVTVLENAFTAPTGQSFAGWNTKANGTGTAYDEGDTFAATANRTLYAQWAYPSTGDGTITYTPVDNANSVTGSVTGVGSISNLSTAFTTNTLSMASSGDEKSGYSRKITGQPGDYSASAYVSLGFKIATGYFFAPSSLSMTIYTAGTGDMKAKVVISDGITDIESNQLSCAKDGDASFTFAANAFSGKKLYGDVTIKVLQWGKTGKRTYIKSPITLTGTVTEMVAPTITEPASDPEAAAYTVGDAITALSITATGDPTPTYQWYKNNSSAATVDNEHKISGATNASYTPSNTETSDFYYYCVASNPKNSATSRLFHVTVSAAPKYDATYSTTKGDAPAKEENVSNVTLPTISPVTGFVHTAWTANQDVKVSGVTVDAGTEIEVGTEVYLTNHTTFTAVWTPTYSVTYVLNGPSGDAPTQAAVTAGTEITLADAPSWSGYEFTGWLCNIDSKVKAAGSGYTMTAAATTFTAQWSEIFAIAEGTHTNGSITIDPTSAIEGTTITLTATPNFKYVFGAWDVYKTDDASTKVTVDGNNQFEMPGYPVTVSATFVADTREQILYLTTKSASDTKSGDKMYAALNSVDDYNVIIEAPASQTLTNYDLIVLHESIGGTSTAAAVSGCKTTSTPVLNTKSWFYGTADDATARWGWGKPDGGKSIKGAKLNTEYCNITEHPIFAGLTLVGSDSLTLFSSAKDKAMQPIKEFASGKAGYTLATSPKNSGAWTDRGCAIQEIPAGSSFRGNTSGKYLLISIGNENGSFGLLTTNGQNLIKNAAAYLLSDETWTPKTLEVSIDGDIDHGSVDVDIDCAAEDDEITLSNEPADGYKLRAYDVYKTDEPTTKVPVTDGKFTMPAYAVTVSATFAELIDITCATGLENGSVAADKEKAIEGETVTLSNTPAEGYILDAYAVYKTGEPATKVTVTDGKFTMPAYAVTVSATFKEDPSTALDNTEAGVKAVKRLENGMLVIEKNGVRYNAQGQIVR